MNANVSSEITAREGLTVIEEILARQQAIEERLARQQVAATKGLAAATSVAAGLAASGDTNRYRVEYQVRSAYRNAYNKETGENTPGLAIGFGMLYGLMFMGLCILNELFKDEGGFTLYQWVVTFHYFLYDYVWVKFLSPMTVSLQNVTGFSIEYSTIIILVIPIIILEFILQAIVSKYSD